MIEVLDKSGLAKLSVKEGEFKIELGKNRASTPVSTPVSIQAPQAQISTQSQVVETKSQIDDNSDYITSPMVGTFYEAPSPTSDSYVKVGDKVKAGQTVCIVEAMKIMNEIQAEFDCEILDNLLFRHKSVNNIFLNHLIFLL